jgi:hypothetical protein
MYPFFFLFFPKLILLPRSGDDPPQWNLAAKGLAGGLLTLQL